MSGIQYSVEKKTLVYLNTKTALVLTSMGTKIKAIFPLHIIAMNLLYITADEKSHYVLVKDLSRFVSRQYNNDNNKKYFCQYFLHGCTSEGTLKNHWERCKLIGVQRIKLPEAGNKKRREKGKLTKIEYQLCLPFVIYADFESVLCKQDSCEPSSKSFTTQYHYHVKCGSCIYVKNNDGWYFQPPQVNMRDGAVKKFLDQVLATATIWRQHMAKKIPMKWLTLE